MMQSPDKQSDVSRNLASLFHTVSKMMSRTYLTKPIEAMEQGGAGDDMARRQERAQLKNRKGWGKGQGRKRLG